MEEISILIKGMELPKEFDPDVYVELACGIDGKRYARLYNFHQGGLTEWCEAVPVPPHGDLIDRDAARGSIKPWSPEDERNGCTFDTVKKLMYTMLDRAPIIIPAESITTEEEKNDK